MAKATRKGISKRKAQAPAEPAKPSKRRKAREKLVARLDKGPLF